VYPMHPSAILYEVQQLYDVSDRLDSLSEQHPQVSEALIGISASGITQKRPMRVTSKPANEDEAWGR
jgi:hypothetical protein